ncbi:MAG: TRAP transporter fused permease subunit, partial [Clostridiales bacterium]|nr:TRAP transporter fused permease subunit [Clostridiales bacterium]
MPDKEIKLNEEELVARDVAEALDKYDKESAFRNRLPKIPETVIGVILAAFSLFQLYASVFTIQERQLRPIHLMFALALVFLLYPAKRSLRRDKIPWYDWLLAAVVVAATLYIPANLDYLVKNIGNYGVLEIAVGIAGVVLLMEACRRVVGLPILIIVLLFLAYSVFGHWIPGLLGHVRFNLRQVTTHMYFTLEGVFGTPLGVCATYIFLFILFGAFLEKTGVGKLFIDLANAIAGKRIGGPAKVAVIASALEGTVSGSSVANTVGSGSFTIPAMKKLGYKPEFAGAVEAAASTGGQIMPPIMGAAAFLMAENMGVSYSLVVKSAIIPAILYFTGILISVHHEARKLGLRGMTDEEMPKIVPILKERGHLLMPLAFMIYMLSSNSTPAYAALSAILTALMAHSLGWFSIVPLVTMIAGKEFFALTFTRYAPISIGVWLVLFLVLHKLDT